MARTFSRPADQRLVSFTLRFSRPRWAALRIAAARAGTSIAVYVHNLLNAAETPMSTPDTKTPPAEQAAKTEMLRATTEPGRPDPASTDALARKQPCHGQPEPWNPPSTSFKTD